MLCVMSRVSVTELRSNFDSYLTRVKAGESFEVTYRGVPFAELRPPSHGEERLGEPGGRQRSLDRRDYLEDSVAALRARGEAGEAAPWQDVRGAD